MTSAAAGPAHALDASALLGHAADDREVLSVLQAAGVWQPVQLEASEEFDAEACHVWVQGCDGMEFGFCDEAYARGLPIEQRGRGPLLLNQIYFHSLARETLARLPLAVPLNIDGHDSRQVVRDKAARAGLTARLFERDTFAQPSGDLIVSYDAAGKAFNVLCMLPPKPWAVAPHQPTDAPDWHVLAAQLGRPWHAPQVRALATLLGVQRTTAGAPRPVGMVDLRREAGVELVLAAPTPPSRSRRFAAIRLYAERVQEARGWQGTLPHGIYFTDGPQDVEQKLGRRPDVFDGGDLSAFALWHGTEFDLHVQFCSVENLVRVATLMQPGFWKRAASV